MLLMEALRRLTDEENYSDDQTGQVNSTQNWTEEVSVSITVAEDASLIMVAYKSVLSQTGSSGAYGGTKVEVDGDPYYSNHHPAQDDGDSDTKYCCAFIELDAGTYTITIDAYMYDPGGTTILDIDPVHIGVIDIADTTVEMDSETAGNSVADGATETILEKAITVPATRKTPAGDIKYYNVICQVFVDEAGETNDLLDTGESASSEIGWTIEKDGTQVDWDYEVNDIQAANRKDSGSFGRYSYQADPGDSDTITIKANNETGGAKTVYGYLVVIISPWIVMEGTIEPVDLDFTPGSTLYVVTEPLGKNPTATIDIGKVRARSWGDSVDYYSENSGTGIQEHNYTFDNIAVEGCGLYIAGEGAVVAHIGVDWK